MTPEAIKSAVAEAFPGAKEITIEPMTLGHRKLINMKAKEPHWKVRVQFDTEPQLAPCFGCALVPESAGPAELKNALDVLRGMEYSSREAAERQYNEKQAFEGQKRMLGGKRAVGEALDMLGRRQGAV